MRYVIIGYGNIGKKRHKIIKNKCVAVVDPFLASVDYSDYREIPLDIFDAAIIAVPNEVKVEMLEYFLSKKKHVLTEKPLLFEKNDIAVKLYTIARINRVIWYTSYNHRFEPMVIKLKELLNEEAIGEIYFANFTYGNGTVQNIIGTWRETGYGVMDDLGCHLLDLAAFLFPDHESKYKIICGKSFEASVWDHCSFSTIDGKLQFSGSTLMWKNTFKINVFGSKGSLHLNGLNKWEGCQLIYRERVYPSGVPEETVFTSNGEDKSWNKDIEYFEDLILRRESSYENDLFISKSINSLVSSLEK